MEPFIIESIGRQANTVLFEKALRTADLSGRKGYDPDFLDPKLPLPALSDEQLNNVALVQKDVGPNGDNILDYTHFSVCFDTIKQLPIFTAVNNVGASSVIGKIHQERTGDRWFQDDRIVIDGKDFQYGNSDYLHSGLARGHMVRYYDPAWGDDEEAAIAMGDTFHYTNCCPQIAYFNGVVWNYLEDYCLAKSIFQEEKVTIFAGPIFNKAKTINGLLTPMAFWKVLVFKKDAQLLALGFIMSQEPYLDELPAKKQTVLEEAVKLVQPTLKPSDIDRLFKEKQLFAAQVKISLIEEKTGLKFGLEDYDDFKNRSQFSLTAIQPDTVAESTVNALRSRSDIDQAYWVEFLKEI